jgi:hypothetical protein
MQAAELGLDQGSRVKSVGYVAPQDPLNECTDADTRIILEPAPCLSDRVVGRQHFQHNTGGTSINRPLGIGVGTSITSGCGSEPRHDCVRASSVF